jgi:Rap1a immunity proteins
LFFVGPVARANAEPGVFYFNGNELWDFCRVDSPNLGCVNYVSAIADAMTADHEGVMGWHACFRLNTTRGQIADVVKLWLQKHPEKRDLAAPGLVAQALAQAFPCPS